MAFGSKRPEIVAEADLQALVDNRIIEDRQLDYKDVGPRDDEGKRECLADVSSFANASGGYVIFGMRERNGEAEELVGLERATIDDEISRLGNMLRDSIKPRLPGVLIRAVPLARGTSAILVHVPRSYLLPHVVDYRRHWRFYGRHSNGKYPLDIDEVRSLFAFSEGIGRQARESRAERLPCIEADETPVPLSPGARVVLHLVPMSALGSGGLLDVLALAQRSGALRPIYSGGQGKRINFEGVLAHGDVYADGRTAAYTQIFRNGCIEAAGTAPLGDKHVPSVALEQAVREVLAGYLQDLRSVGVDAPLYLMLTLLGVYGFNFAVSERLQVRAVGNRAIHPIDRRVLDVPDRFIESLDANIDGVLRPVFDVLWNAAGWPRSMSYDEQGRWVRG